MSPVHPWAVLSVLLCCFVMSSEGMGLMPMMCHCDLPTDVPEESGLQAEYEKGKQTLNDVTKDLLEKVAYKSDGPMPPGVDGVPQCTNNMCTVIEYTYDDFSTLYGRCAVRSFGTYRVRGCLYEEHENRNDPAVTGVITCKSALCNVDSETPDLDSQADAAFAALPEPTTPAPQEQNDEAGESLTDSAPSGRSLGKGSCVLIAVLGFLAAFSMI